MPARRLDLVLIGATGHTGRLVASHLAKAAPAGLRWAIAGRNRARLEEVARHLSSDVELLVTDGNDAAGAEALVRATRVVCTTVGPYRHHGRKLAHACARLGAHYCDITGEVDFMRASIDENHAAARQSGVRLVHACGFDSVPSDLGVHVLRAAAQQQFGVELAACSALVRVAGRGSRGGMDTVLDLQCLARTDATLRELRADPYALDPEPRRRGPDGPDAVGVTFDREAGEWTAPFIMAPINTRVVRRSAALLGYDASFRYTEAASCGRGARGLVRATVTAAALRAFAGLAARPVVHPLLRALPPASGEGSFHMELRSRTVRGDTLAARFAGTGDPGLGPTSIMLAESALCLTESDGDGGLHGVLTPASAIGPRLVERLRACGLAYALT